MASSFHFTVERDMRFNVTGTEAATATESLEQCHSVQGDRSTLSSVSDQVFVVIKQGRGTAQHVPLRVLTSIGINPHSFRQVLNVS